MKNTGTLPGAASRSSFVSSEGDGEGVARGDDPAAPGVDDALSRVIKEMGEQHEIKVKVLGADPTDAQQAKLIDGRIRAHDDDNDGVAREREADRRAEMAVAELSRRDSNGVSSPGAKRSKADAFTEQRKFDKKSGFKYRPLVMRANYSGVDRPDIQKSAAKGPARKNSDPMGERLDGAGFQDLR